MLFFSVFCLSRLHLHVLMHCKKMMMILHKNRHLGLLHIYEQFKNGFVRVSDTLASQRPE